jgi:hypothetical protein
MDVTKPLKSLALDVLLFFSTPKLYIIFFRDVTKCIKLVEFAGVLHALDVSFFTLSFLSFPTFFVDIVGKHMM